MAQFNNYILQFALVQVNLFVVYLSLDLIVSETIQMKAIY